MSETVVLREQSQKLAERLTALEEDNQRLSARYEALRTSVEEVRLEARSLGWFAPGEVPVRTQGATLRLPPEDPNFSMVPRQPKEGSDTSFFFRVAWPLLFFLFSTFFAVASRLWPPRWAGMGPLGGTTSNLPVPLQTGLDFFRK